MYFYSIASIVPTISIFAMERSGTAVARRQERTETRAACSTGTRGKEESCQAPTAAAFTKEVHSQPVIAPNQAIVSPFPEKGLIQAPDAHPNCPLYPDFLCAGMDVRIYGIYDIQQTDQADE